MMLWGQDVGLYREDQQQLAVNCDLLIIVLACRATENETSENAERSELLQDWKIQSWNAGQSGMVSLCAKGNIKTTL